MPRKHEPGSRRRLPQGPAASGGTPVTPKPLRTKLNTLPAHINLGDLLLSIAESQPDPPEAKAAFAKAVEQYDLVLKVQPNSIEAVNNKAWILHSYLRQVARSPRDRASHCRSE